MGFYEKLRDGTAHRLISQKGTAMSLRWTTPGTINEATQQMEGGSAKAVNLIGVMYPSKVTRKDGAIVKTRTVILDAYGLTAATKPQTDYILRVGTGTSAVDYTILTVDPLDPGGIAVIYTVTVQVP